MKVTRRQARAWARRAETNRSFYLRGVSSHLRRWKVLWCSIKSCSVQVPEEPRGWFWGKVQHLLNTLSILYADIYIAFLRWVSGKQIKLKWNARPADLICFHIKVSISFSVDRNLLLYLRFCSSLSVCTHVPTYMDNVQARACVFTPVGTLI